MVMAVEVIVVVVVVAEKLRHYYFRGLVLFLSQSPEGTQQLRLSEREHGVHESTLSQGQALRWYPGVKHSSPW